MAKTFEVTKKVVISVKDLQLAFLHSMPQYTYRLGNKGMRPFYASYDWDKILNSAKLKKFITEYMKNGAFINSGHLVIHFYNQNSDVHSKVKIAFMEYYKGLNIQPEPTIKVARRVVMEGTKNDIARAFDAISNMEYVVTIDD